jgi:hypothetical protein
MASRDLTADFLHLAIFVYGISIYSSLVQKKSPEIMACPCQIQKFVGMTSKISIIVVPTRLSQKA